MKLRMFVYDHGVGGAHTTAFPDDWTLEKVLAWGKAVRKMPGIWKEVSAAVYEASHPPIREEWRKD